MEEKIRIGFHLYAIKENNELTGVYQKKSRGATTTITPSTEELAALRILPAVIEELETGNILEVSYTDKKFYACIQKPTEDIMETKYQQTSDFFLNSLVDLEEKISKANITTIELGNKEK